MTPIFLSIETVNGNSVHWDGKQRREAEWSQNQVFWLEKKKLALRVFIWFRIFGFGLEY